jgi:hypothetical protein
MVARRRSETGLAPDCLAVCSRGTVIQHSANSLPGVLQFPFALRFLPLFLRCPLQFRVPDFQTGLDQLLFARLQLTATRWISAASVLQQQSSFGGSAECIKGNFLVCGGQFFERFHQQFGGFFVRHIPKAAHGSHLKF